MQNNTNLRNLVRDVRKMLNQRKVVFFQKYPDARKQQIINNAQTMLACIEKHEPSRLHVELVAMADRYILPLMPSKESRFHDSYMRLYNTIKSL